MGGHDRGPELEPVETLMLVVRDTVSLARTIARLDKAGLFLLSASSGGSIGKATGSSTGSSARARPLRRKYREATTRLHPHVRCRDR